jgi:uncharacterized membrane protein YeaQ/YmgE (transglycosylase-associated protein family)
MTPEQTLTRPKLIYAIYGAVFGICFPLIILIQNFPVDIFTSKKGAGINDGFFIMLGGFIVWAVWCLICGALVGMLTGLLMEKLTKKRTINQIVVSLIGALLWSIVMAILALGVPALLILLIVAVVGQNGFAAMLVMGMGILALFGGIVMLIPYSIISFTLSTVITSQIAKRARLKTLHYFLAAASLAAIFCGIALIFRIIAMILR